MQDLNRSASGIISPACLVIMIVTVVLYVAIDILTQKTPVATAVETDIIELLISGEPADSCLADLEDICYLFNSKQLGQLHSLQTITYYDYIVNTCYLLNIILTISQ